MEFTKKKLPIDLLDSLYRMRIDTVQPYALMFSPVYILLNENQKFVSVKAPLDFFTPEELKRLTPYVYFYMPRFVLSVVPFRDAGLAVRDILTWRPNPIMISDQTVAGDFELDPPSFEVTDTILKIIGPLWWDYPGEGIGVQPFLSAVFVNELCDLLPQTKLIQARERDSERFEMALLQSSWIVFMALHLGYCELNFLNDLRLKIFEWTVLGRSLSGFGEDIDQIIKVAQASLPTRDVRLLKMSFFGDRVEKVSQKMVSRLSRIESHFISKGNIPPSIYGERGFIDEEP